MPELPEIEIYKRYLEETALHKKITRVDFLHTGGLQNPQADFEEALIGKTLTGSRRLGKYLLISTSGDKWLVLHFGMTGKIEFFKHDELPKYTRIVLYFGDEAALAFRCRRKLAKWFLTESPEVFRGNHELGPDALDLDEKEFLELLEARKGSIKGVLTDQHILAGIGNVYSDEMLYQCKVHPKSKTDQLTNAQQKKLFNKMKEILQKAIEVEGERSEFPEDYLISHRKDGEDCPRCKGKIKQIKVSGRSTYFCTSCQKLKA